MAKLGSVIMTIQVDDFLKDTRIRQCIATECKNNLFRVEGEKCNLKAVEINSEGQCNSYDKF